MNAHPDPVEEAAQLLRDCEACILTGAGISTESGIPDYRGPERRGKPVRPMTYREFTASAANRRKYWARSALGWEWMQARTPNNGHHIVAALERAGYSRGVVTQNVDGLHHVAGSRRVVELHGALRRVLCLECGRFESRAGYQERIIVQNPGWLRHAGEIAPDGDVALPDDVTEEFQVPACQSCGGVTKPDVVFFGENVPRTRVEQAFGLLDQSDVLLVLGSSLTVYSGYRFATAAEKAGKPVVIVNDGPTRADPIARVRVPGRLGTTLASLSERLDLPDL